jgi:hypothetical protein
MICGAKWKSCECPWFNFDAVELDRIDPMQLPINASVDRDRFGALERGFRPNLLPDAHSSSRPWPQNYEEEMSVRRLQEQRDEDLARRLQYADIEEEDDDYMGRAADMIDVGSSAGHSAKADYRRPPTTHIAAPVPPASISGPYEVTNALSTNYVSGVARARGKRANSMERRLADRFSEQRQAASPTHRAFAQHIPPPPAPPLSLGPLPPPAPPSPPMMRRHTVGEETYQDDQTARLSERLSRAHARPEFGQPAPPPPPPPPGGRGWHWEPEPDFPVRGSQLAGLSGPGAGMNRVYEWANHVEPTPPDSGAVKSVRTR